MGVRAQRLRPAAHRGRAPRGAALPAALFGLVTVTVLASAIFAASTIQQSSTKNREASARALQLAEDGLAHAVTVVRDTLKGQPFTRLLRGSDNSLSATADDGRITGYGMSSAINIPVAGRSFGGGSYTALIYDDNDGDGNARADVNFRVKLRCDATTADGGKASLEVVLGVDVLPAIAANGNLTMSNNAKALGYCGAVHANGNLTFSGPNTVVASAATASNTVSGTTKDSLGGAKSPIGGRPPIEIPAMTYTQFCGTPGTNATTNFTDVEIWLGADGLIYRKGVPLGTAVFPSYGWTYTLLTKTWSFSAGGVPAPVPGKVCAEGNVEVAGNIGSAANPFRITVIATGSVKVSGNPYLAPATTDSIAIVSGGDVSIAGNPAAGATSYEGLIYAHSQCLGTGSAVMRGQLLCANNPTPVGATEWIATTTMQGNFQVTYGCGGFHSRRRIYSWLQRVE